MIIIINEIAIVIDIILHLPNIISQINIMKKISVIAIIASMSVIISSCGSGTTDTKKSDAATNTSNGINKYDPNRGEGKFKEIVLEEKINETMVGAGNNTFTLKCAACHKLTDEKLVGPGWKGVTSRRKPEWIMNFITNTDEMINKDPAAQAQLEICLVRMPSQSLSDDDARALLEFMRKNDSGK